MDDANEAENQQKPMNKTLSNEKCNESPKILSGLNRPIIPTPLGEQSRAVRRQALMVILANIGVLSSGMSLAIPTVILPQLESEAESVHLSHTQAAWFASINTLSCPLGGLLSGVLLDRIGRKRTLYVLNVLGITAWILLATASATSSVSFFGSCSCPVL